MICCSKKNCQASFFDDSIQAVKVYLQDRKSNGNRRRGSPRPARNTAVSRGFGKKKIIRKLVASLWWPMSSHTLRMQKGELLLLAMTLRKKLLLFSVKIMSLCLANCQWIRENLPIIISDREGKRCRNALSNSVGWLYIFSAKISIWRKRLETFATIGGQNLRAFAAFSMAIKGIHSFW